MAIRRSARLRSSSSLEPRDSTPQLDNAAQLASVDEQDEAASDDDSAVRTPIARKTSVKTPKTAPQLMKTARTPTSGSAARPPREEMHPSKAHQSTTRKVDSGLILGFNPIKRDADGKVINGGNSDTTPSKSKSSPAPAHFGTPGYDIQSGQESQLSEEAKQLMERVREDAKQLKEKMLLEKSRQDQEDNAAGKTRGDRKYALPKGKAGRFSGVHMAEFKKMDSIAGHASSFRGEPGRFQPVTKSLKRTKSKAQLDEPESQDQSPSRSSSAPKPTPAITTPVAASKRTKYNPTEDSPASPVPVEKKPVSVKKPAARSAARPTTRPAGPRSVSAVRSSLMTPTRASIARNTAGSLSLKAPKTSLIPSLARSPSTQGLASPRTPRTDFNPRIKNSIPTLNNLKSILRKRQPLFSRDPSKIAAGTHVAAPDFKPGSLFAPKVENDDPAPSPSPKKHVAFTPSINSRYELGQASPSRSKIPTTPSRSNLSEVTYPTLPTLTPEGNKPSVEEEASDHLQSPTIRHVRQSNANQETCCPEVHVTEVPVVAHGIAHGIGNKKRHRDEVDDDAARADDRENVPPADALSDERSTKRLKAGPNPPTPSPVKNRPIKTPVRSSSKMGTPGSITASAKKSRSVLSLSRLNMLAKPKGSA